VIIGGRGTMRKRETQDKYSCHRKSEGFRVERGEYARVKQLAVSDSGRDSPGVEFHESLKFEEEKKDEGHGDEGEGTLIRRGEK